MLFLLLKVKLRYLFSSMFKGSKNKKKRNPAFKILIGIFALYVLACLFFMFGSMAYSICQPLVDEGLGWLYFTMLYIASLMLCFIFSLFTAKGMLFSANDNELLLSMPIRPSAILASRMLSLLVLDYVYELFVMIPGGVIYAYFYSVSVSGVILFVLGFLTLPLLALVLSCIFGWGIAWLSAKFNKENLISAIFTLVFLGAYFWGYSRMQSGLAALVANGASIGDAIRHYFYPAYAFGTAIVDGNYVNFLLSFLCGAVPFALVYAILTRSFIKIATGQKGAAKKVYHAEALKVSSPRKALIIKELRHFTGNAMFVLNGALGILMMLICTVLLIVKQDYVNQVVAQYFGNMRSYIGILACLIMCAVASCDQISPSTISLEGKSLWIAQTLPVPAGEILLSKADMQIIFCVPSTVLLSLAVWFVLGLNPVDGLFVLVLPIIVTVFIALLGVAVNLKFPKFDWTNEVACVKQGMAVIITMFASWGILALPAILYGVLLNNFIAPWMFMAICTVLFSAASWFIRRWLVTKGARLFDSL